MPNFGIIEALERVTTPLTLELRELLQGITEEQRRTNNLLGQLVGAQREQAAAAVKTPAKKPSVR